MDLDGEARKLVAQYQQRRARDLGQGRDGAGAHLVKKVHDPARSLRRDQPELRAMPTDGVDQLGALTHQKLAGTRKHQHTLAFRALDRHEPHRRSGHRFAYRFGIGGVVLLTAKISLHIGRRHQAHLMAQRPDLPRPMVRGSAGFHPDQARLESGEEAQHLASSQLLAGHGPGGVKAMELKDRLGEIVPDGGILHGGWSLHEVVPTTATVWRNDAGNRGHPPHQLKCTGQ